MDSYSQCAAPEYENRYTDPEYGSMMTMGEPERITYNLQPAGEPLDTAAPLGFKEQSVGDITTIYPTPGWKIERHQL